MTPTLGMYSTTKAKLGRQANTPPKPQFDTECTINGD